MKPSSSTSSTASSASSTSSSSSSSNNQSKHVPINKNRRTNAGSGSFNIVNEKSLSSADSSSSSSQQSTIDAQDSADPPPLQQQQSLNEDEPPPIYKDAKMIKFIQKLSTDYDTELEKIGDKATEAISNGSFFNYGLYQFLSFLFISIAWTIGNGWYAYVSVFSGYVLSLLQKKDFMRIFEF